MHSTPGLGPRVGSVTYRVLCDVPVLILALPPGLTGKMSSMTAGAMLAVS
jgi:hypothetical protein